MKIKLILFAFMLLAVPIGTSCTKEESNAETALIDVTTRFPQLPQPKQGSLTEFYKLKRAVIIGEQNIELQLRSMADSINDYQQILIIRNAQNDFYAIPFFSNTYRDYWDFQFDNQNIGLKANTTFETEFNNAMVKLNMYDSKGGSYNIHIILDELFKPLLLCSTVKENDSLNIKDVDFSHDKNMNTILKPENRDSCKIRFQKNYEDIVKNIHPAPYYYVYLTYWDTDNNRIYRIDNYSENREPYYRLKLKTYRQDCVNSPPRSF